METGNFGDSISPNDLHVVPRDEGSPTGEMKIATLRLRHQKSIKRIAVQYGQFSQTKNVPDRHRQNDQAILSLILSILSLILSNGRQRQSQSKFAKLDLDL